jgi:hypothetical protein
MFLRDKRVKLLAFVAMVLLNFYASSASAVCGFSMVEYTQMGWGGYVKPSSGYVSVVMDSTGAITYTGLTQLSGGRRGKYGVLTTGGGTCHTDTVCLKVVPDTGSIPSGHDVSSFKILYRGTAYAANGTKFCGLTNPGSAGVYFYAYGTFDVYSTGVDTGGAHNISFDVIWTYN